MKEDATRRGFKWEGIRTQDRQVELFRCIVHSKKLNLVTPKQRFSQLLFFPLMVFFLPPSSSTSAKKWFFAAFKVGRRTFKNVTVVILAKKRPAHNFLGDLLKHLSNFFKIAFLQFWFFSRRPGKNPKRPKSATHTLSLTYTYSLSLSPSFKHSLSIFHYSLTHSLSHPKTLICSHSHIHSLFLFHPLILTLFLSNPLSLSSFNFFSNQCEKGICLF